MSWSVFRDAVLTFVWSASDKQRNISAVRISSDPTCIRTWCLPNMRLDCYRYTNLPGNCLVRNRVEFTFLYAVICLHVLIKFLKSLDTSVK
jgi:hypothetical protein